VESTAIVRVNLGAFGTLPKNFPPAPVDFSGASLSPSGGGGGAAEQGICVLENTLTPAPGRIV
jgi:hypothetical protein